MARFIDPRFGDIEDDASSTKQRSLLGLAGGFLAEISLPKLMVSGIMLIVLPGVLLGLAPLLVSRWAAFFSMRIAAPLGLWTLLVLALVVAVAWWGGRRLLHMVEEAFWALNSVLVQPGYVFWREGLRHLTDTLMPESSPERRARVQALSAAGSGILVSGVSLWIVWLVWPYSRWNGGESVTSALANTVVLIGSYLAAAALVWGLADATMDQPRDLASFDPQPQSGRIWRIAHLSDIHVVGERYGFRIESGRGGPRGNDRLARVLARLDAIHAEQPLDFILITGDMTDAGRSSEWAEFLSLLDAYPHLMQRMLVLPGNHDVNVVDRANPARLDLPTSPTMRLRQMRTLSATAAVQGDRVYVVDSITGRLGPTLSESLAPNRKRIAALADTGRFRLSFQLEQVWADAYPMVLPPESEEGLGVILLNSNAETHFSFTNALGVVSTDQGHRIALAIRQFPRACWIVALHHHMVEYPRPASAFSERVGTALINGSLFLRRLRPLGRRVVTMHGHRHIDWIGECGGVRIISAPSPVMEATEDELTCFYIQRLSIGPERQLCLLEPQRVEIPGFI